MRKLLLVIAAVVLGVWLLNVVFGFIGYSLIVGRHEQTGYLIAGIGRASELRARVSEFFQQTGRFPNSNRELGIGAPETYRHGVIKRAAIGDSGEIRIDYAENVLNGASVIMRPVLNVSGTGPAIHWDCYTVGFGESITALVREPTCTALDDRKSMPVAAEPAATIESLVNAIHMRRHGTVQHLIAAGVNVEAVSASRETPLSAAVMRGDSTVVEMLIRAGVDVNRRVPENGPTPLMTASKSRCNPNVVRMLIAAGARLEVRDDKGMTALMHAARAGEAGCLNVLLEAGANADATDNSGSKAINHAAHYGRSSSAYAALRSHDIKQRQGGEFVYRLPASE